MEKDRLVIFHAASEDDVRYWTHYADHMELDPKQRQAAKALREGLRRLLRYRDRVDTLRSEFPRSAFSGKRKLDSKSQELLFEVTTDFFHCFYSVISSWASFLVRVAPTMRIDSPPTYSVAKLISWMTTPRPMLPALDQDVASELAAARAFRALVDHPSGAQPFDWRAEESKHGFAERILVFGPASRTTIPVGAEEDFTLFAEGGWSFLAPDEVSVSNAMMKVLAHYMPIIAGRLPRATEVTCPDFPWEQAWNGDRPVHSEPSSIYDPHSGLVDPFTREPIRDRALTKQSARER